MSLVAGQSRKERYLVGAESMEWPGEKRRTFHGYSCLPVCYASHPCGVGMVAWLHPVNYLLAILLFMIGLLVTESARALVIASQGSRYTNDQPPRFPTIWLCKYGCTSYPFLNCAAVPGNETVTLASSFALRAFPGLYLRGEPR